jgi:IS30 family transposase
MARRMVTVEDRVVIAAGLKAKLTLTVIAAELDRSVSVISRDIRRHRVGPAGYGPVSADSTARLARSRPQQRKIDADPVLAARVRADLRYSRTPRQIAGRLHLEAGDATVGLMGFSPDAQGRLVSHEGIYRWIYALPKGELARQAIMLRSKRSARQRRRPVGERSWDRIVGMVSIDDRPEHVTDRKVPGWWEGDLIVGKGGSPPLQRLSNAPPATP